MDTSPLRQARRARGWTLKQLAERAGLDVSQLSRIELDGNTTKETAARLSRIFKKERLTELHILYPERFR